MNTIRKFLYVILFILNIHYVMTESLWKNNVYELNSNYKFIKDSNTFNEPAEYIIHDKYSNYTVYGKYKNEFILMAHNSLLQEGLIHWLFKSNILKTDLSPEEKTEIIKRAVNLIYSRNMVDNYSEYKAYRARLKNNIDKVLRQIEKFNEKDNSELLSKIDKLKNKNRDRFDSDYFYEMDLLMRQIPKDFRVAKENYKNSMNSTLTPLHIDFENTTFPLSKTDNKIFHIYAFDNNFLGLFFRYGFELKKTGYIEMVSSSVYQNIKDDIDLYIRTSDFMTPPVYP